MAPRQFHPRSNLNDLACNYFVRRFVLFFIRGTRGHPFALLVTDHFRLTECEFDVALKTILTQNPVAANTE